MPPLCDASVDLKRGLSILGFSEEEKLYVFKITAGVLLLGELKFAQRSGGDQAFPHGIEGGRWSGSGPS